LNFPEYNFIGQNGIKEAVLTNFEVFIVVSGVTAGG
jgi:hypothetical protein